MKKTSKQNSLSIVIIFLDVVISLSHGISHLSRKKCKRLHFYLRVGTQIKRCSGSRIILGGLYYFLALEYSANCKKNPRQVGGDDCRVYIL
jgi:hypothetical protein